MLLRLSTTLIAVSLRATGAFLSVQPSVAPIRSRLDMGARQQEPSTIDHGFSWGSAAATAVVGWTLAAQVASASLVHPSTTTASYGGPENIPIQQSSVVVAREIETLDFSMPSYDDVTKGGSAGGSSSTKIPSFNPFGDFEPQFIRPSPTPDAPAAPAPAPAAPVVVDNQPFEFKAPVISLPEVKAPELPSFKAPDLPKLEMPKLDLKTPEMPKFSMPSLSSPRAGDGSSSFSMPAFGGSSDEGEEDSDEPSEAMQFKVPDLPKLSLPSTPDIKVPSFEGLKLPSLSMPELPKLGGGGSGSGMEYDLDIPKFEMDAPKVSMPQLSLPAFPSFGGGGESASSGEEELEPQEVRDERAREARQVFLSFDSDAKVIEQQAREARNLANEKKKLANEAKDEACKTRPGGKWICLRNPFTAGF